MVNEIIELADRVIAGTYKRFPIVLTRGKGCTVWDSDGRAYLDFIAGIAVCSLGHAHPRIARALATQAETLLHVSNLYYTVPQVELADRLTRHSFADRVFFCNSGAEANEAAIKLARKRSKETGTPGRYRIIAADNSFHGRTMATLSATGQEKIRKGFDPVLSGFDFVPFGDLEALEKKIGPETCGVLLEPIQGEGGVNCPDKDYLKGVRRICDAAGVLLILDEIQTGMGRTGKLFAHEHFGIEPDIMTLAKALGNGVPIGAMLAREKIASAFGPGAHASTFGGTPIATAAALETVKILLEEGVIDRCAETGAYFINRLEELAQRHDTIADVRGLGLLIGMELTVPGEGIVNRCLEKGFLVNCIQANVLRFAPPLIVEKNEIDALIRCLDESL
jgi:acetylornithine/N-succinyldiaminopimelate aminotransferase